MALTKWLGSDQPAHPPRSARAGRHNPSRNGFHEGGGGTYVTLMDHRLDAHVVGALSLDIGIALSALALVGRARTPHSAA